MKRKRTKAKCEAFGIRSNKFPWIIICSNGSAAIYDGEIVYHQLNAFIEKKARRRAKIGENTTISEKGCEMVSIDSFLKSLE